MHWPDLFLCCSWEKLPTFPGEAHFSGIVSNGVLLVRNSGDRVFKRASLWFPLLLSAAALWLSLSSPWIKCEVAAHPVRFSKVSIGFLSPLAATHSGTDPGANQQKGHVIAPQRTCLSFLLMSHYTRLIYQAVVSLSWTSHASHQGQPRVTSHCPSLCQMARCFFRMMTCEGLPFHPPSPASSCQSLPDVRVRGVHSESFDNSTI